MAYFKIDNKPDGRYLRIVKSSRKGGKVVKETVYSLGKVEDYTPEMLQRMGLKLYELGGGDPRELLEGIEELARYNYGYYQIYQKALLKYSLDHIFDRIGKKHKLQFNLTNAVLLMIFERLNDPASKRQNYYHQEEYYGLGPVELHHLYRTLDYLADYNELIQAQIYQAGRDLFSQTLDVVFFDVTTFYFESDVRVDGALRQFGFSKDGKIGNTQVLFALLIDRHKNPIGFEIYSGNTFEGNTFADAIKRTKAKYNIENVIIVADRGMLSKQNIAIVESNHYQFIVGERLKTLPKKIKEYLLNIRNYTREWTLPGDEQHTVKYASIPYEGRLIISTYSQKRAKKDSREREEKIARAKQLLKHPSQLQKKAHHYFLQSNGANKYSLNEERLKENERYDGFLAIATNALQLPAETILENYAHLFQIEHSFRTFKSYLETRPMFHWTDKRILGHLTLCFICYALLNYTLQKINAGQTHVTENSLRQILDKMQMSLVRSKNKQFFLRSRMDQKLPQILSSLGLRQLPNIIPSNSINKYL